MKYTRSDFPKEFLFGTVEPTQIAGGFDSYRIHIPWDQIQPDGHCLDTEALDRLAQQIDLVLEHGLRPCITLGYGTLPPELDDLGGWRNRDIAKRFADFAETVVARTGELLYSIATIGPCPNQGNDQRSNTRSLHHQLLAHGQAVRAMRSYGVTNIGTELNQVREAIVSGSYPAALHGEYVTHLPDSWQQDLAVIAEPVDWYGLSAQSLPILRTEQDYSHKLPLVVTLDADAPNELERGLDAVQDALLQSVPITGVFLKSLNTELPTFLTDQPNPAPWVRPKSHVHAHWNLVADIGGTNTRLGVVTNGELTDLQKHPTGTLADLHEALHSLRDEIGTDPRAVVAAGAGPVKDGAIRLTNANLLLTEDELAQATGAHHTFVINDFTAAAWSVAEITGDHVEVLQGESTPPMGTRLVVGPGTGLGVGALIWSEGHFHTASGEGGHMGLSPRHRDEVEVFEAARRIVPECFFDDSLVLEAEMFLSGTGLPVLYQAVGMAHGLAEPAVRSAKDILQDAQYGTDSCAVKAARMFTEHLGAIIGDLSVALVPTGGVFLVGGVAEKNRWLFGQDFLRAFNAGGRFDALRQGMNVYVSEQDEFGIVGANNFCKNALAR